MNTNNTGDYSKNDLLELLNITCEKELEGLFRNALQKKIEFCGNKVYLRGLIEVSNICQKNCFYCGIRRSNLLTNRYILSEKEIVNAAVFAWKNNFGSLVIQSGERNDKGFSRFISNILREINLATNSELGITLSCGEQDEDTYKRWKDEGALRYLLRIETSSEDLYYRLHPSDSKHSFRNRLECIEILKKLNYQTGTGVMIGLPFQTPGHLVNDLWFFKEAGIDMVGMGPYIEHPNTPLSVYADRLLPVAERYLLGLKMIAALRLLMPDINIASTTALETLNHGGRLMALRAGANVFMPNLTPENCARSYTIYSGKTHMNGNVIENIENINRQLADSGQEIGFNNQGNPLHYFNKGQETFNS